LALCKEIKKVLPYISNGEVAKGLIKSLNDYLIAYKKLGGKL
jgi:sRNA-binding regulator protein Hfq